MAASENPAARTSTVESGDAEGDHHLIGGGVASLAAAVFLTRDAGVPGNRISIYEQSEVFGGSLDASGSSELGYVIRGARMFERNFVCAFDLLSSIPARDGEGKSVRDEIDLFNREVIGSSKCRLVRDGKQIRLPKLGLRVRDHVDFCRLFLRSERSLQSARIDGCFSEGFFCTDFWIMWSTMFAFAPWHSAIEFRRYLRRFIHLFPNLKTLEGVMRTRLNQYDDLISPIVAELSSRGVRLHPGTRVDDLHFDWKDGLRRVVAIEISRNAETETLSLSDRDRVFLTLGSMTAGAVLGSTAAPPPPLPPEVGEAWDLWRRLAAREQGFGNPEAFFGDVAGSKWESFTVTLDRPDFFEFMRRFTGNPAGTGGLVTLAESNWLMSVVLFHQPHFRDQPDGVYVFWGNGLYPDRRGNFVAKPMTECSGEEILQELCGHLGIEREGREMLAGAICIPCLMPYITSQFMPRALGDRPPVILPKTANLAVMGQYCEMADDVVFTVEYSVRSAMIAVYSLLGVQKKVPDVHRADRNPLVLLRALATALAG